MSLCEAKTGTRYFYILMKMDGLQINLFEYLYTNNLHLKIMDAGNNHHMAEALFKAFGKALDMATMEEPRMKEAWTTKGSL